MALPAFIDTRVVQNRFVDITGQPMAVEVTFRSFGTRGGGGVTVMQTTRSATNVIGEDIQEDGLVSITLVCGDDTDLTPFTGYEVTIIPINDASAEEQTFDISVPIGTGPLELDEARAFVFVPPPAGYVPTLAQMILWGLQPVAFTGSYLDLTNSPSGVGWLRFFDQTIPGLWDNRGTQEGPRSWRALTDVDAPIPTEMLAGDDLTRLLSTGDVTEPLVCVADTMLTDGTLLRLSRGLVPAPLTPIREVTADTTLTQGDGYLRVDSPTDVNVFVPLNDTVDIRVRSQGLIRQVGAGRAILVPEVGPDPGGGGAAETVGINGLLATAGPDTSLFYFKAALNTWDIEGGVVP